MKLRTALLAAALVQAAPALAAPPAASPLLGIWSLDVARMTIPANQRPRSVTIKFSDAGAGRWNSDVEIIGGEGGALRGGSTAALDGVPVALTTAMPEADKVALMAPEPNVLVMTLIKDGKARSTRTYTVAPGGKSMIETVVYLADSLPQMQMHYFNRSK
jgi:hypothetical protein